MTKFLQGGKANVGGAASRRRKESARIYKRDAAAESRLNA